MKNSLCENISSVTGDEEIVPLIMKTCHYNEWTYKDFNWRFITAEPQRQSQSEMFYNIEKNILFKN